MNLLDLAEEIGLKPHKTSTSLGGEYHCPCPHCGGIDRFMFWPEENRYWCRQCNAKGDAIQFCRDFQGLSFQAACLKLHKTAAPRPRCKLLSPAPIHNPSCQWTDRAKAFAEASVQRLLIDKTAIKLILHRGLTPDTINKNQLGWNPIKIFNRRTDWGIKEEEKQKWICLPAGIIIPIFEGNDIRKLKIRRSDWCEGDFYGKYCEIPGSSNIIPIFGDPSITVSMIVEAELDAMLIIQEAEDLCNCIALGGVKKRPHPPLHKWLLQRKLILFALDFDEAGKKEYSYWQKFYPNLEPWPVPEEKSAGDYFVKGGNLKAWISSGLKLLLKPFE